MKRLMILSSLLALTASVPSSSHAQQVQPYAVPYDQRYEPVRIAPAAPQPLADEVRPKVNILDLVAQAQKNDYARSQFVVGRRLIRLSQTGL